MQHTKEEVRNRILEAAEAEFDESGYAGASMRKIVERSNTSLGNLYRYYKNKEELFLSIVNPVLDECIEQTGLMFDVELDKIEETVDRMVDFVAEHRRIFRIIENGPPEHYTAFINRFAERVSKSLEFYAVAHCPEYVEKIANPKFFDAVGQCLVGVLRLTLEHYENRERTAIYLRELLRFQFGCFVERLGAL